MVCKYQTVSMTKSLEIATICDIPLIKPFCITVLNKNQRNLVIHFLKFLFQLCIGPFFQFFM